MTGRHRLEDTCGIHGVPEPLMSGDFKLCGECYHVWRTQAEFENDCRELAKSMSMGAMGSPVDLDPPFCPLCSHDF